MIELVAFLGNYGSEYENTRHNVSWLFASSLPFYNALTWQNKHKGEFCTKDFLSLYPLLFNDSTSLPAIPKVAPGKVYFIKPLTYMNLSGESVGEVAKFYKIESQNILVVHDEIELPLGTVSLKYSGGLGGHNGLRSIKSVLGTADFWRLRIGVGKPANGDVANYVLGAFSQEEKLVLSKVFSSAGDLFSKVLTSSDANRLLPEWKKKTVLS